MVANVNIRKRTVGEALGRYEREIVPGKRSRLTIESQLKKLREGLGRYLLVGLTSDRVAAYATGRIAAGGLTAETLRKELNTLNRVLKFCVSWRWMDRQSFIVTAYIHSLREEKILPKVPKNRLRRPTARDLKKLRGYRLEWLSRIVDFTIETGLTRSEIAGLRWEHIRGDIALVPGRKGPLQLSKAAVAILRSVPERGGATHIAGSVFGVEAAYISTAFWRASRELGLRGLTYRDACYEYARRRADEEGECVGEVRRAG